MIPSDAVEAARAGHSWAFEHLYKRYAKPLRAFAATRGSDDPDGLANDALAAAFRALPGFTGDESAFRGFVFHIARRRLIDEFRRTQRRVSTTSMTEHDHAVDGPDPLTERLGTSRALSLINSLTDDQRDVLVLRVMCDLSLDETATALDKSITAVKALQRRGLTALRKNISAQGVS